MLNAKREHRPLGMRGPPKTPTAVLKLRGSWRAKVRTGEPMLSRGIDVPKPPPSLGKAGRKAWKAMAPMLHNSGVLTDADLPLLERYCNATADYAQLRSYLDCNGLLNPDGSVRRAAQQINKVAEQLLSMERQLGMSPAIAF